MNHNLYDGDTFTTDGRTFRVRFEPDTDAGYPWDEYDGCGIVREDRVPHWHREGGKRPGERPMNKPDRHETQFYYDWAATMRKARADSWGLADGDWWKLAAQVNGKPTAGQVVAESVRKDFEFCQWAVTSDCPYVGVIVELLGPDGEPVDTESLWQVDTYVDGYHRHDVPHELAGNILADRRHAWRKAMHEARERHYWAARDVATAPS